jgi:hypothetical protein
MWQEYFPNGTIIGADIHPGVRGLEAGRIVTEIADQSNIEDLVRLGTKHGPFHVIIEDGSHMWEHQVTTLRTLFPFVVNGGFYIIEDLHTNFGSLARHYRGAARRSCVDYLNELVAIKAADDQFDSGALEDPFLRTYGRSIELITFLKGACIIRKGRESSREARMPGVTAPQGASDMLVDVAGAGELLPLSLACHIGAVGDWHSHTGALRSAQDGCDIQGFVMYGRGIAAQALQYRARLADGTWTDWVGCGAFAGTMGRGQSLTGFSARLLEEAGPGMTLSAVGLFRGQDGATQAGDGEDCVANCGQGELYGMQCMLRRV